MNVVATRLARRTRLESCPKPHPTCAIHRIIVYYCPKEHDKRRIESTVQRLGKRPYRADHFDHEHRQVRSGHLCIRQRLAQPPKAGVSVPGRDRRRERPRNRRDRRHPAAIRTDGNIQPQPSLTVEKVSMDEGDIVMVKVGLMSLRSTRRHALVLP